MKDSFRHNDWSEALSGHLTPSKSQPTAVEQPRDEPTAAVDANPPTPARNDAPAPPTADRSTVELDALPDLWHDKFTDVGKFTAFLEQASSLLARQPTAEQFAIDLLEWAGRTPNKRNCYYQKVLDMTYVLGLTDRVDYASEAYRQLQSQAPAQAEGAALRKYCARAAVARLKNGSRVLHAAFQLSPVTQIRLMKHLKMEEEEAHCYLRLFVNLGLLTEKGLAYCVTTLASGVIWEDVSRPMAGVQMPQNTSGRPEKSVSEKSESTPYAIKQINACPALLPDKPGIRHSFLESVLHARRFLLDSPTKEDFLREMITWAGKKYPKSVTYHQNVLDSYYVVGAIELPQSSENRERLSSSPEFLAIEDIDSMREYCANSALSRLKFGRLFINTAWQLKSFSRDEIRRELSITRDNAARHMRLFSNLKLLDKVGATCYPTQLIKKYITLTPIPLKEEKPVTYSTNLTPSVELHEPTSQWEHSEGLEVFAYLGDIE